jgi:hypothetical protein
MKFDIGLTTAQASFTLSAVPDDVTDGQPPIDMLLIDTPIHDVAPGNQVVAGILAFEQYIGQEVSLHNEVPRMVERSIREFFSDRPVGVTRVSDLPRPAWPSAGTMHVSEFDRYLTPPLTSPGHPHDYYVQVADGAVFNGALASAHQLVVASNALLLSRLRNGIFSKDALLISVGVLLSRDLHLRKIHIKTNGDVRQLNRYRMLLRAIDLNLSWSFHSYDQSLELGERAEHGSNLS